MSIRSALFHPVVVFLALSAAFFWGIKVAFQPAPAVPERPAIDQPKDVFYFAPSVKSLTPNALGRVLLQTDQGETREVAVDSVRMLHLADNGQDTVFPTPVFQFKNLRYLWVGMRGFKRIPPGIGVLEKLEEIDLQHSAIEVLPEDFCRLKQLRRAIFLFSNLKKLPECIGDLGNLEYLHVGNTALETFPESMAQLKNLKTILIRQSPDKPHLSAAEISKWKMLLSFCTMDYRLENIR